MEPKRTKISIPVIFVLVVLALLPVRSRAEEYPVLQDDNMKVLFDEQLRSSAELLLGMYPQTLRRLEDAIGWKLHMRPTTILMADREQFEEISGAPFIAAFAVPRRQLVVMLLTAESSRSHILSRTFEHELCHLLLHEHIREGLLPKWLDEGICQWISGSLGEFLITRDLGSTSRANLSDRAFPLERLAESFPDDRESVLLAYAQSRDFVRFIQEEYGREGLLRILDSLKAGADIEDAFLQSLSKSLETVEMEWHSQNRRVRVWLIWLSQYLYELLFFIAALLAAAAFLRLMIRKRRYGADKELDEDTPDWWS